MLLKRGGRHCQAQVIVCVPHDKGKKASCVDGGSLFDSLKPTVKPKPDHDPHDCKDSWHSHDRDDDDEWHKDHGRNDDKNDKNGKDGKKK